MARSAEQSRCRSIPIPRRSRRSLITACCASTYQSQRRLRRSSKRSRSKKAKANQEVAFGKACQHTDLPHPVRLLRAPRERPRDRRAAEQRDELALFIRSRHRRAARSSWPCPRSKAPAGTIRDIRPASPIGINHRTRLSLDVPRELQPATCPALQPSQSETAECGGHRPGSRQLLSSPGSQVAQLKIRTDVVAFRLRKTRRAPREYRYP